MWRNAEQARNFLRGLVLDQQIQNFPLLRRQRRQGLPPFSSAPLVIASTSIHSTRHKPSPDRSENQFELIGD
jgi:hypothetical protein